MLDDPDPRAPVVWEENKKRVQEVRELVRVNHHRNCLLCHAPANTGNVASDTLTAAVPASMVTSYFVANSSCRAGVRIRMFVPDHRNVPVMLGVTWKNGGRAAPACVNGTMGSENVTRISVPS